MPGEWWETFFDTVTLDCWRQVFSEDQTQLEADFLLGTLKLTPPAKILDVPCGEGRLCRAAAAQGFAMTGLDFSRVFLDEARRVASANSLQIKFHQGDMRHMTWEAEFDGAFCMGGSWGYFDDAGHAEFLKSVFRALKPGGRFVLDASRVAELVFSVAREREWIRVGDMLFLEENSYNPALGRMETEYTFVRDGQEAKKKSSDRIYTYREICRLLEGAGFAGIEGFGSFEMEPFRLGSRQLYLISRKS